MWLDTISHLAAEDGAEAAAVLLRLFPGTHPARSLPPLVSLNAAAEGVNAVLQRLPPDSGALLRACIRGFSAELDGADMSPETDAGPGPHPFADHPPLSFRSP